MKTTLTEIAFILDRSGSMESLREQAITSFNHFLADQAKAPGEAHLTLVLFDDAYLVPVASRPLRDVPPLDASTYVPRGSTALLDAIGRTIDELGQRLAAAPAEQRPGQVVVAILTDGYENASSKFTWPAIAQRIRHQRDKYQWSFLFLGANQDAIATASKLAIHAADAATFEASTVSFGASIRSVSRKTTALRTSKAHGQVSPDETKSMKDILAEESQD